MPSELHASQPPVPEPCPEGSLGIGLAAAKMTGKGDMLWVSLHYPLPLTPSRQGRG